MKNRIAIAACSIAILLLACAPAMAHFESSWPTEGLNTNYDTETGFTPGGTDPDDRGWYIPAHTDFPYMRTDPSAPTTAEIEAYIDLCENSGPQRYAVRFINSLDELTTDGSDPRVQIVPNHVILEDPQALTGGYATFTLYFPPGFKATADHRHPIFIFGSGWRGGLNEMVSGGKTYIADTVNLAATGLDPLSRGLIGVATNCGGDGSVGYTRWFLRDVAQLIDLLHTEYTGDRDRVVTRGSSRGGAMALIVAENPYEGDPDVPPYTVIGAFSRTFPIGAGTKTQIPLCLIPTYNAFYTTLLGDEAGRYDHDPPPLSNPAPVLAAPMGTTDVIEADARSADGQWLHKLAGTFVALQFGSHDSWMGRQSYLHIDRKMSLLGIRHISIIVLTPGHNVPGSAGSFNEIANSFLGEMFADPAFEPAAFRTPLASQGLFEDARNYYIRQDTRIETLGDWSSLVRLENQRSLPFMATIPYRLGRQVKAEAPWFEPGGIELSGAIGRQWEVVIRDDTDTEVARYSGTFGLHAQHGFAESAMVRWGYEGLPNNDVTSHYTYQFFYENDQGDMVDVSFFTNFMLETSPGSGVYARPEAKTEILEYQPYPSQYLISERMMAFGVDWCESLVFGKNGP